MQVRAGQVIDVKGKLMQIQKYQHTQGSGRQLGNVQVGQHSTLRSESCHVPYHVKHLTCVGCLLCSLSCGTLRLAQSTSNAAGKAYTA